MPKMGRDDLISWGRTEAGKLRAGLGIKCSILLFLVSCSCYSEDCFPYKWQEWKELPFSDNDLFILLQMMVISFIFQIYKQISLMDFNLRLNIKYSF